MNWLIVTIGVLALVACGATGGLVMLLRARRMRQRERAYGVQAPYLQLIAVIIGVMAGLIIGSLGAYFLSLNIQVHWIEWVGRFSYVLIAWAGSSHLFNLIHSGLLLRAEERGWRQPEQYGRYTLGYRRRRVLDRLRRRHRQYADLKTRDDALIEELIGFLGTPLANARRDMGRIPLYGYLGTVCGILLVAQELGRIDAATETFRVLGAMAGGLVLAFATTLAGLLTYLPLRKIVDSLIERVGLLEEQWTQLRDDAELEL